MTDALVDSITQLARHWTQSALKVNKEEAEGVEGREVRRERRKKRR